MGSGLASRIRWLQKSYKESIVLDMEEVCFDEEMREARPEHPARIIKHFYPN